MGKTIYKKIVQSLIKDLTTQNPKEDTPEFLCLLEKYQEKLSQKLTSKIDIDRFDNQIRSVIIEKHPIVNFKTLDSAKEKIAYFDKNRKKFNLMYFMFRLEERRVRYAEWPIILFDLLQRECYYLNEVLSKTPLSETDSAHLLNYVKHYFSLLDLLAPVFNEVFEMILQTKKFPVEIYGENTSFIFNDILKNWNKFFFIQVEIQFDKVALFNFLGKKSKALITLDNAQKALDAAKELLERLSVNQHLSTEDIELMNLMVESYSVRFERGRRDINQPVLTLDEDAPGDENDEIGQSLLQIFERGEELRPGVDVKETQPLFEQVNCLLSHKDKLSNSLELILKNINDLNNKLMSSLNTLMPSMKTQATLIYKNRVTNVLYFLLVNCVTYSPMVDKLCLIYCDYLQEFLLSAITEYFNNTLSPKFTYSAYKDIVLYGQLFNDFLPRYDVLLSKSSAYPNLNEEIRTNYLKMKLTSINTSVALARFFAFHYQQTMAQNMLIMSSLRFQVIEINQEQIIRQCSLEPTAAEKQIDIIRNKLVASKNHSLPLFPLTLSFSLLNEAWIAAQHEEASTHRVACNTNPQVLSLLKRWERLPESDIASLEELPCYLFDALVHVAEFLKAIPSFSTDVPTLQEKLILGLMNEFIQQSKRIDATSSRELASTSAIALPDYAETIKLIRCYFEKLSGDLAVNLSKTILSNSNRQVSAAKTITQLKLMTKKINAYSQSTINYPEQLFLESTKMLEVLNYSASNDKKYIPVLQEAKILCTAWKDFFATNKMEATANHFDGMVITCQQAIESLSEKIRNDEALINYKIGPAKSKKIKAPKPQKVKKPSQVVTQDLPVKKIPKAPEKPIICKPIQYKPAEPQSNDPVDAGEWIEHSKKKPKPHPVRDIEPLKRSQLREKEVYKRGHSLTITLNPSKKATVQEKKAVTLTDKKANPLLKPYSVAVCPTKAADVNTSVPIAEEVVTVVLDNVLSSPIMAETPVMPLDTVKIKLSLDLNGLTSITSIPLPLELREYLKPIIQNGYKVFLKGGFLRDWYLAQGQAFQYNDFDFITDCSKERLSQLFPSGYGNKTHDKLFKLAPHIDIFVSTAPTLVDEAQQHCDFYPNALFGQINILHDDSIECSIYDPLNAYAHFREPELRLIGDFKQRLTDDPSLILRFIRFAHQLNKTISDADIAIIQNEAPKLRGIPWGVLLSNLQGLFFRNPREAFLNLRFLIKHNILPLLGNHWLDDAIQIKKFEQFFSSYLYQLHKNFREKNSYTLVAILLLPDWLFKKWMSKAELPITETIVDLQKIFHFNTLTYNQLRTELLIESDRFLQPNLGQYIDVEKSFSNSTIVLNADIAKQLMSTPFYIFINMLVNFDASRKLAPFSQQQIRNIIQSLHKNDWPRFEDNLEHLFFENYQSAQNNFFFLLDNQLINSFVPFKDDIHSHILPSNFLPAVKRFSSSIIKKIANTMAGEQKFLPFIMFITFLSSLTPGGRVLKKVQLAQQMSEVCMHIPKYGHYMDNEGRRWLNTLYSEFLKQLSGHSLTNNHARFFSDADVPYQSDDQSQAYNPYFEDV
jgi:tRNA nucleotidyltransferase/poly(A) polymerase